MNYVCVLSCFTRVWLFATPWTVAIQTPLSMGFSRQEYWSGLPCSPPEDIPHPGIKIAAPGSCVTGRFKSQGHQKPGSQMSEWIFETNNPKVLLSKGFKGLFFLNAAPRNVTTAFCPTECYYCECKELQNNNCSQLDSKTSTTAWH